MPDDNVTWRDYVDTQMKAVRDTARASERTFEARLEKLNELHKIVESIQAQGLPRNEHIMQCKAVTDRMDDLNLGMSEMREAAAELRGKASMGQVYLVGLGVIVSIITSIAGVVIALAR